MSDAGAEVLCLGETMAAVSPLGGASLREAEAFQISPAGAESNVARCLQRLGHRAAWVSRVGRDPLGQRILDSLSADGVDVSQVQADDAGITGVMFKDPAPDRTTVHYYRRGSAAAALGPELISALAATTAPVVHLTGVTPALSSSCTDLISRIMVDRALGARRTVSFDVNYRPSLWPDGVAAGQLLELARAADVVLVGLDEARALWGTDVPDAVRQLLTCVPVLVVKDGPVGATAFEGDERVFVPALRVRVVEPVGAGDSFAAGWLAATRRRLPLRSGLRLAHVCAAATLLTAEDNGVPPDSADIDRMLALPDTQWAAVELTAPERVKVP